MKGMASNILSTFLNRSLLSLFFTLGCFSIFSTPTPTPSNPQHHNNNNINEIEPPSKRRNIANSSLLIYNPNLQQPNKSRSRSILSYLNRLIFSSFRKLNKLIDQNPDQPPTPPSPPPHYSNDDTSRTDVFPCSACGEVLTKPRLLDLHQAANHSLSELRDGDSGRNIVQIIFSSGWRGAGPPTIHSILKVHNTAKTLARFEEYREIVRSRAERNSGDERCIADGNERLRFYCSTILCALGPRVGVCGSSYCSTCAIVRHGFGGKQADLDGIATHATGWGAHVSLPEELESEFAFLHVRRAVLVCRVVAGRVARGGGEEKEGAVKFDSVSSIGRSAAAAYVEGEELLVFNPRAVLPCFVIIYSV